VFADYTIFVEDLQYKSKSRYTVNNRPLVSTNLSDFQEELAKILFLLT